MIRKLGAVAWITALEALSHPVTLLLLLTSTAGTLVLPLFQFQQFTEDGRLARDCGLATALLFGLMLAVGGATRLTRTLHDGTSAVALTKPLSRGLWLSGMALGQAIALTCYGLAQGAAVLLAEAFSPRYHVVAGARPDVAGVLGALAALAGALVVAALNHRLRRGRFVLSGVVLMAAALWGVVAGESGLHWGSLSALAAIGLALVQVLTLALALAVVLPAGLMVAVTVVAVAAWLCCWDGSAYLPLDALAEGGAVSGRTLLYLVPQAICGGVLFLWCGALALKRREVR